MAGADNGRTLPAVEIEPSRALARSHLSVSGGPGEPEPAGEPSEALAASGAARLPAPKSTRVQGAPLVLKSVTFDLVSGIKTLRMTDGTVHEEAVDSSIVSKLGALEPAAGLNSFIEQVRTNPPQEVVAKPAPAARER